MQDYLKELNERQLKAVTSTSDKILVLAGAGSGKTKTLTSRIKYLIDSGVDENCIVAFTFTNKAAQEMKSRLRQLLRRDTNVHISTFHSYCFSDFLMYGHLFGYKDFPNVLTVEQRSSLIKEALSEFDLKLCNINFFDYISKIKNNSPINNLTTEEAIIANKVYHRYQELLVKYNAIDFDDMIPLFLKFLQTDDGYALAIKESCEYVLVDECQDTNQIQYDLIQELASINNRIFMVGDNDQQIYSFRNSNSNIIESFKNSADEVIILNQNYRCAKNILELANNLIENNTNRIEKELFSTIETVAKTRFKEFDNVFEEAKMVAALVKKLIEKGYPPSEVAVLYRNNNQSYLIEKELAYLKVPYQVFGSLNFLDNEEIAYIISIYRLILNPKDLISFNTVCINKINGMDSYVKEQFMKTYNISKPLFKEMVESSIEPIHELGIRLTNLYNVFDTSSNEEFFMQLVDEFNLKEYINNTDNRKSKYDRIMVLKGYIVEKPKFELLKLFNDLAFTNNSDNNKNEKVSLLTIHKSKGLEFKCVVIIGCNEGIIPPANITKDARDEERRTLYVGITRAREVLYITSAINHYHHGVKKKYQSSSFLMETGIYGEAIKTKYFYN